MAIEHAAPGEVVDILGPAGSEGRRTAAIFKTRQLEVIRMMMPEGKELAPHRAAGELTIQCLEGLVAFSARGRNQELRPGQIVHLLGGDEHALKALKASSLLLTIAVG